MSAEEHEAAFFQTEIHEKYRNNLAEIREISKNILELKRDVIEIGSLNEQDAKSRIDMTGSSLELLGKRLEDVSSFFEFYLGDESSVNIVLLERDAYMKINQILRWNIVDVRELMRWIRELEEICKDLKRNPHDLIDFRSLPTSEIPEKALRYPVWAIDKYGYCLAGQDYSEIIHIDEVLEEMESGRVPFPLHKVSTK